MVHKYPVSFTPSMIVGTVIDKLVMDGVLKKMSVREEEQLYRKIDPWTSFTETPHLFVSKMKGVPSALVYQGSNYKVDDPALVKKMLGLKSVK
jgi:hypothetical protein